MLFADLLAQSNSLSASLEQVSVQDRRAMLDFNREIAEGDAEAPSPSNIYDPVNSVHTLTASGASAGTFVVLIGFRLANGIPTRTTTAAIAFDAVPATIESAVDTAMASVVPGWTNGDIAVTGAGTAELNDSVFTYSGASVAGKHHPLSLVIGGGLTGGGAEAFTDTVPGQSSRNPWAIMKAFSLVGFTTLPTQGASGDLSGLTRIIDRSTKQLSDSALRVLAREAAIQDTIPNLEETLLDLMGV